MGVVLLHLAMEAPATAHTVVEDPEQSAGRGCAADDETIDQEVGRRGLGGSRGFVIGRRDAGDEAEQEGGKARDPDQRISKT